MRDMHMTMDIVISSLLCVSFFFFLIEFMYVSQMVTNNQLYDVGEGDEEDDEAFAINLFCNYLRNCYSIEFQVNAMPMPMHIQKK